MFDPSTKKLPDFLEELNQGVEKDFSENAKNLIDSRLYVKLPPQLKRSVNMTRLENGTYDEIVALLERELELNALEESDDLPITTMAMLTNKSTKNGTLLSSGIKTDPDCNYCKEDGHVVSQYEKNLKARKKKMLKLVGNLTRRTSSQMSKLWGKTSTRRML